LQLQAEKCRDQEHKRVCGRCFVDKWTSRGKK
jgi:hypothetical protein